MDAASLLLFAGVFAIACASPGPAIAALIARVMGRGTAGAPAFCLGLLLGDVIWLACAVFGLAAVAETFHPVFVAIKYLGVAYLLYLAWKLWTAPAGPPSSAAPPTGDAIRLFAGGVALTLGNPKTMLFYLSLLPTIISLPALDWLGFFELALVVAFVYAVVLGAYVLLAARARRAFRSRRAMKLVNRGTGALMASAALTVATRN